MYLKSKYFNRAVSSLNATICISKYPYIGNLCVTISLVICPALTDPTNGRITCSLGIDNQPTNGDICSFTCNSGYRLRGSTSRVCLSSPLGGSWTGSYTSCSEGIYGFTYCVIILSSKRIFPMPLTITSIWLSMCDA